MARLTRFKGLCATNDGFYCGTKGSEDALVIPLAFTFGTTSAAQTVYSVSPVAGNVISGYVVSDISARATTFSCALGSAGTVIATGTMSSGVAGVVSTMTLGTVAVTSGASISVARGVTGTTGGVQVVVLNVQQLS